MELQRHLRDGIGVYYEVAHMKHLPFRFSLILSSIVVSISACQLAVSRETRVQFPAGETFLLCSGSIPPHAPFPRNFDFS